MPINRLTIPIMRIQLPLLLKMVMLHLEYYYVAVPMV